MPLSMPTSKGSDNENVCVVGSWHVDLAHFLVVDEELSGACEVAGVGEFERDLSLALFERWRFHDVVDAVEEVVVEVQTCPLLMYIE